MRYSEDNLILADRGQSLQEIINYLTRMGADEITRIYPLDDSRLLIGWK